MKFTIFIIPTAQERADSGAYQVKDGVWRSRTYKSKSQRSKEETIKACLLEHKPCQPMRGQLLLGVRVYFAIPKSKPAWFDGTNKEFQEFARAGFIRHQVKPDLDNAVKQIKDCLSQMRFWEDDKLVVGYLPGIGKYYSDNPRWEIEIVPWDWRKAAGIAGANSQGVLR